LGKLKGEFFCSPFLFSSNCQPMPEYAIE